MAEERYDNQDHDIIKVYNPKEMPFGPLSNNFESPIYIKNVEWKTVTHYVYANMLRTYGYQTVVRNSPVNEVRKIFEEFYAKELSDLIRNSASQAYEEKMKNQKMIDSLLGTGDSNIIYVSDDPNLGFGQASSSNDNDPNRLQG